MVRNRTYLVDAVFARLIVARLQAAEVDADPLLAAVGVRPESLIGYDARIPFAAEAALLEAAAGRLEDPLFAITLALGVDPRDMGLLAYIAANSETCGDALKNLARYLYVFTEGDVLDVRQLPQHVSISFDIIDPAAAGSQQIVLFVAGMCLHLSSWLVQRDLRPECIRLRIGSPGPAAEAKAARLLRSNVQYLQSQNEIVGPAAWTGLPVPNADDRLLRVLEAYANDILQRRHRRQDFAASVEEQILRQFQTGDVAAGDIATALGVSPRTLARRLQAEGTSFTRVLEQLRRRLAETYLRDTRFKITEIAYLLGYADTAAFGHAFRRWHDRSPSHYRAAHAVPQSSLPA